MVEPQQGATYEDQLRVAKHAEKLGFGAFIRSDHFLRMGGGDPGPGPDSTRGSPLRAWLVRRAVYASAR